MNRTELDAAVDELRALQRERAQAIKSRVMQSNRLQAIVAGHSGYSAGLEEEERKAAFREAAASIKEIRDGNVSHPMSGFIEASAVGLDALEEYQLRLEKPMLKLARQLPVYSWCKRPEQKGFGDQQLAVLIGECGNLSNYAHWYKLWRRMGCAPWEFGGQTKMGATWRSGKEGKLPAMEWEAYGYSPRRRSISYLIGETLLKGNGTGPYRTRYLEAKQRYMQTHELPKCSKCDGRGCNTKGTECPGCKGTGKAVMRAHLHGMLLMTKLLLKNIWREWRDTCEK